MSSSNALLPVSVASIVTGFISFAFTLLIWINNFWSAFATIAEAPKQVRDNMAPLRQALYEEREHLKVVRRKKVDKRGELSGIYAEGGPLRVISDAVSYTDLFFPRTMSSSDDSWNCSQVHRVICSTLG